MINEGGQGFGWFLAVAVAVALAAVLLIHSCAA
jgi:hypothetical protein